MICSKCHKKIKPFFILREHIFVLGPILVNNKFCCNHCNTKLKFSKLEYSTVGILHGSLCIFFLLVCIVGLSNFLGSTFFVIFSILFALIGIFITIFMSNVIALIHCKAYLDEE